MNRILVGLALLLVLLVSWERLLVRSAAAERSARGRVGRLISEEERAALPIAALRVELPGGEDHLYGRQAGDWLCISHRNAPADPRAIAGLIDALTKGEGMLRTAAADEASSFGVSSGLRARVSLCGPRVLEDPSRDVLIAFDVGKSIEGREGAFVRLRGSTEIWSLDTDPNAYLQERQAPGLPPLLEPGVIAAGWEGWPNLERIRIEADGRTLELQRVMREVTPDEVRQGTSPFVWLVDAGDEQAFEAFGRPATGFTGLLRRLPYVDVVPEDAGSFEPEATVTLSGGEGGAALQLELGQPDAAGRVRLRHSRNRLFYLLEGPVAAMLLPERSWFEEEGVNPWEALVEGR